MYSPIIARYVMPSKSETSIAGSEWYFSNAEFVKFKNNLEQRIKWRYSGETELIVLQSNPEWQQILNFQNYVSIDVNYGIKNGYIDSFQRFMEALVRSSIQPNHRPYLHLSLYMKFHSKLKDFKNNFLNTQH